MLGGSWMCLIGSPFPIPPEYRQREPGEGKGTHSTWRALRAAKVTDSGFAVPWGTGTLPAGQEGGLTLPTGTRSTVRQPLAREAPTPTGLQQSLEF